MVRYHHQSIHFPCHFLRIIKRCAQTNSSIHLCIDLGEKHARMENRSAGSPTPLYEARPSPRSTVIDKTRPVRTIPPTSSAVERRASARAAENAFRHSPSRTLPSPGPHPDPRTRPPLAPSLFQRSLGECGKVDPPFATVKNDLLLFVICSGLRRAGELGITRLGGIPFLLLYDEYDDGFQILLLRYLSPSGNGQVCLR